MQPCPLNPGAESLRAFVAFRGYAVWLMHLKQTAVLVSLLAAQLAAAAPAGEVVGSAYRADTPFPQFLDLWSENWSLKDQNGEPLQYATPNMPLGAYVQLYIHNPSATTNPVTDVKLDGVSLTDAIAFSDHKRGDLYPASIHFSKLPKPELDRLVAAGEPVWWKVEPPSLPPGGFAEVTIRLRRQTSSPLRVQVLATQTAWEAQVSPAASPRFMGISFSPALDTVFCYVLHPQNPGLRRAEVKSPTDQSRPTRAGLHQRQGPAPATQAGTAPMKVLLDGADVTARTTIAADKAVNLTPLVIRPAQPLTRGSFHFFEAVFADGSTALAGIRAWSDDLVYGMWGYVNHGTTAQQRVDYYLGDLQRHNVNAVMQSYGGEVGDFLAGQSGVEHSRTTGIRAMRNWPGNVLDPVYYFLKDEPDAHDYAVNELQPTQRLGSLGQDLVRRSHQIRQRDPAPPHLLNLDNTYKPENWYMYAQLPDVCCADPYLPGAGAHRVE